MKQLLYGLMACGLLFPGCKKDDDQQGRKPLTVKSFWPNSGSAGTIVTISGTGFGNTAADNEVLFNGVAAVITDVRDSVMKVLAPETGTTGMITVKRANDTKEVGQYTYQALTLSGIFPANGPAGTNVSIRGKGFGSMTSPVGVSFNGKPAVVTSSNDTLVVAAVPAEAGSGKIVVMVDGREVTGPDFLFQQIAGMKPLKGGKGTRVTITGEGFDANPTANTIAFNGKQAQVVSASTTQLVAIAPDEVATGPVTVTINGQQTTGSTFTVIPLPLITAVAPLSGPVGTEVTITGNYYSNITEEVKVTFNGIPAVISSTAEKAIVVKVPANAGMGAMVITVNDQVTEGPQFTEQNLGVAKLIPDNGMDGDEIVINGVGFSAIAADNKVTFNGIPAVVKTASPTSLTVTVPANVTTGTVSVEANSLNARGPVFGRAGVITVAGGPGNAGLAGMSGIAIDSKGNLFVATGNMVKKITPDGMITAFAGSTVAGFQNGTGTNALFNNINGMAIDLNDDLYVSDQYNFLIRKITPAGVVSTTATLTFLSASISADPQGNMYVGESYNGAHILNKVTGAVTKLNTQMYETGDYIAAVNPGEVYYAVKWEQTKIFGIVNGSKITLAGNNNWGFVDGPAADAQFRSIFGLVIDPQKVVYALDNSTLRKIQDGFVTTIAGTKGTGAPVPGYTDGSFKVAQFGNVDKMAMDKDGNLYILDVSNNAVRKVFFK